MTETIYVSIGNSDDKLSQAMWAAFVDDVDSIVRQYATTVHGQWFSLPGSRWQNACWCFEAEPEEFSIGLDAFVRDIVPVLNARGIAVQVEAVASKVALKQLAPAYQQDSIAWARVKETEYLGGSDD